MYCTLAYMFLFDPWDITDIRTNVCVVDGWFKQASPGPVKSVVGWGCTPEVRLLLGAHRLNPPSPHTLGERERGMRG